MPEKRVMALTVGFILAFTLSSCMVSVQTVKASGENPQTDQSNQPQATISPLTISMPVEYVNYTVSKVNGVLWATVDGTYPMQIPSEWVGQELPMLYPTPPGVTNISIDLNGQTVGWSNYTQAYPDALHYTYLGNWSMIICTIQPASADFLLTIHYQHPVFPVNGSYVFLYDLNISPYLSDSSSSSIAYFNVRFETSISDIHVYTVPGDSSVPRDSTRTPINFTISQSNSAKVATFNITSDYSKPVPGDELITFQDSQAQVPEFPMEYGYAIVAAAAVIVIIAAFAIMLRKRK